MSNLSGQLQNTSVVQNPRLNHQPPPPQFYAHYQSISPYTNPNFAFNPYLNSGVFPSNQNSGVYPPNYGAFVAQPINHFDYNGASSNWVVNQVPPLEYSHAIPVLRTDSVASASYETPVNYNLVGQNLVTNVPGHGVKPKQSAATQSQKSVRCELCNIECNSIENYEKHVAGKKHNKSLLKLSAPTSQSVAMQASQSIPQSVAMQASQLIPQAVAMQASQSIPQSVAMQASQSISMSRIADQMGIPGRQSVPRVSSKPVDLESKKQILVGDGTAIQSIKVCTICNVTCNGEIAFADHLAGKKHAAQELAHGAVVNSNPVESNAQHPITKKRKVEEPAPTWCDVCKISCTNNDGLKMHFVGKKHQKNLVKFQNPNSNTIVPAINKSKLPKDVETKKRNIMECGVAANALKTCIICNVVCNSDKVFYSQLTSQKHAAMMNQIQAAAPASAGSGLQIVYPAT